MKILISVVSIQAVIRAPFRVSIEIYVEDSYLNHILIGIKKQLIKHSPIKENILPTQIST